MKTVSPAVVLAGTLFSPAPASAARLINAAGATFPDPDLSKWFNEYHKALTATCRSTISRSVPAAAFARLTEGTVDFGASDMPMTDDRIEAAVKTQASCTSRPCWARSSSTYNVPGVTAGAEVHARGAGRNLPGQDHEVERPELITADNPGVKLPDSDIVVVHRSDGSGTTYIWTDYLSKVSPEWKTRWARTLRSTGRSAWAARATKACGHSQADARTRSAMSS